MPTDVSGTINIIAEVVGNNSSAVTGTGNSTLGKPKKEKGILALLKDVSKSASKMAAILGIGGLLASSKIISGTMSSIMRIFGTFMDIIIGPIAPLLVRGLVILATVVMWIRKLLTGESAWSDAWAGLKQWWIDTWNEKGGLWGIFTEGLKNITGVALIAALFASIVATPMAGVWVMKQFFGVGKFLTKSILKGALGLLKFTATAPFKAAKFVGKGLFNLLPSIIKRPLLAAKALLGKMFTKTGVFLKSTMQKALGLLKWGASAATAAGKWAWSALMFGGTGAKKALIWSGAKILGMMGLTGLFSAAGGALLGVGAALLIPALLGIIIVGATVTTYFLADYLMKKAFGVGLFEASDAAAAAREESLGPNPENVTSYVAATTLGPGKGKRSFWEWFIEAVGTGGQEGFPGATTYLEIHSAGSEITDPAVE